MKTFWEQNIFHGNGKMWGNKLKEMLAWGWVPQWRCLLWILGFFRVLLPFPLPEGDLLAKLGSWSINPSGLEDEKFSFSFPSLCELMPRLGEWRRKFPPSWGAQTFLFAEEVQDLFESLSFGGDSLFMGSPKYQVCKGEAGRSIFSEQPLFASWNEWKEWKSSSSQLGIWSFPSLQTHTKHLRLLLHGGENGKKAFLALHLHLCSLGITVRNAFSLCVHEESQPGWSVCAVSGCAKQGEKIPGRELNSSSA